MDATVWYYLEGDKTIGPVTEDQARELYQSNVLHLETLVWTQGFSEWIALRHTGLYYVCHTIDPPPLPSGQPTVVAAAPKMSRQVLRIVAALFGYGIGYLVMRDLSPDLSAQFLGGAGAGLVIGLLPFFIAKHKHHARLGRIALVTCIASGLVLGILLALPVAILFSIVIAITKTSV